MFIELTIFTYVELVVVFSLGVYVFSSGFIIYCEASRPVGILAISFGFFMMLLAVGLGIALTGALWPASL